MKMVRATLVCFVLMTVLTGVIYPLAVTGVAKGVFAYQAEGSLVDRKGKLTLDEKGAVGSALIGQTFDAPGYFWSRPSATGPQAYNASASSGSNLGPTNSALTDAIKGRIDALHQADAGSVGAPVPVDLVTASGSGLDPEESVAAAEYQVARVAAARGVAVAKVEALIEENTVHSVVAETAVNVVTLNLALDRAYPLPATTAAATAAATSVATQP